MITTGDGDDTITTGDGGDTINTGDGNDTIWLTGNGATVINDGRGADTVHGFIAGADGNAKLDLTRLTGVYSLATLLVRGQQESADAEFDFGGGDTLRLTNVSLLALNSGDFIFRDYTSLAITALSASTPEGSGASPTPFTFTVALSEPANGVTLGTATALGVIYNDDASLAMNATSTGINDRDVFVLGGGLNVIIDNVGLDVPLFQPSALAAAATNVTTFNDFSSVVRQMLDLPAIAAISGSAGNDAFTFTGTAALDGLLGQTRWGDHVATFNDFSWVGRQMLGLPAIADISGSVGNDAFTFIGTATLDGWLGQAR